MKILNILFASIIILIINNNHLYAQNDYSTRFTAGVTVGYGFYSPSDRIKFGYFGEDINWGGLGANINFLFNTKMFNSHLKLGFEIGAQTLESEESASEHLVWKDTGKSVKNTYNLNGNYVQFLSNLYLFSVGSNDIHSEAGVGVLFFWDKDRDIPFSPTTELMISAKLISAIHVSSSITIHPQVSILKGLSSNDVFVFNVALGVSTSW